MQLWSTLFVSIAVQALPFLVLGVALSGLIAAFVSPELVERLVPRRPIVAVPAAGVAGLALPGCECGSVTIAGRLAATGTPPAAALTFLLAAPAINPVVLISTAVAFPGNTSIVLARFLASFSAAVLVGWWWASRRGTQALQVHGHDHDAPERWLRFTDTASRDLVHAGGYLIVGAAAAATLQLIVPRSALDAVLPRVLRARPPRRSRRAAPGRSLRDARDRLRHRRGLGRDGSARGPPGDPGGDRRQRR